METINRCVLLIILLLFESCATAYGNYGSYKETKICYSRKSKCFLKKITCPAECPTSTPKDPKAKVCNFNCDSPICKAACKRKTIILFQNIFFPMSNNLNTTIFFFLRKWILQIDVSKKKSKSVYIVKIYYSLIYCHVLVNFIYAVKAGQITFLATLVSKPWVPKLLAGLTFSLVFIFPSYFHGSK